MPVYSEETQDIMKKIPNRILHMGLSLIFCIILMILLGTYFLKYPDIISCPVVFTTINPPQELKVKSTGKIVKLYAKEHEYVRAGQLIAFLENSANFKDAMRLEEKLKAYENIVLWDSVVRLSLQNDKLSLGELQSAYIRFCKAWSNFHNYLKENYIPLKMSLLEKSISQQENYYKQKCLQSELYKQDFLLAQNKFRRDSIFYNRYKNIAVSITDYEKQVQEFLNKKSTYMNICMSLQSTKNDILKLNEDFINLKIQYRNELRNNQLELDETYCLLKEALKDWKNKYVLESAIDGQITFTGYWCENQIIQSGERLATIVPKEKMEIIGRAEINMLSIGKVKKGQHVKIKLEGFPYSEYGFLKGIVNNISLVPEKDKGYIAEILLTNGMMSSYQYQLRFIQQMEGTAEIVTKQERVLVRLINPLKSKIYE